MAVTHERAQGYLVTINGRKVFIRRLTLPRHVQRDLGLPRIVFEVMDAGLHATRREAIAEARWLVRAMERS